MLFNSYQFILVFLPITIAGFYALNKVNNKAPVVWICISSILFYSYWDFRATPVLLISTGINYFLGRLITEKNILLKKKWILIAGIVINLLALGYFKYLAFFAESLIALTNIDIRDFLGKDNGNRFLPLGISFYTFTQIAYLIDCYAGSAESEKNFIKYLTFVNYFPHLIAGPVIQQKQILPQFNAIEVPSIDKINVGLMLLSIGLIKKVFLADGISIYSNLLFDSVSSGTSPTLIFAWLGAFAYSLQLYFDFSGYSDMAVGISLLFGIILPANFDSPFHAKSMIEFWKKWHISLTNFISKYFYTPLSLSFARLDFGSRVIKNIVVALPILITFLILGLWHGAGWTYILFGLLNGLFILVNHIFHSSSKGKKSKSIFIKIIYWLLTFCSVTICFVMFRAELVSDAMNIYKGMLGLNSVGIPHLLGQYFGMDTSGIFQGVQGIIDPRILSSHRLFLTLAFCWLFIYLIPDCKKILDTYIYRNSYLKILELRIVAFILGIITFAAILNFGKKSPFLYFQF